MLSVSRRDNYYWRNREASPTAQVRERLDGQVKIAFEAERTRAGWLRLKRALGDKGTHAGRHQIAQPLKRLGLRAKAVRKFKAITKSNYSLPVVPDSAGSGLHCSAVESELGE